MLIIWSGWGILVPVFNVVGFLLAAVCMGVFQGVHPTPVMLQVFKVFNAIIWGGLAAIGIFLFNQHMAAQPGRTLIDPQTNQKIVFRKSAGSFFFIPTKYWTFITLGVWALGLVVSFTDGKL